MGGTVDAPRETAHDGDSPRGEIGGQGFGHVEAVGGGSPRAHDGDGESIVGRERAPHVERRAEPDGGEQGGIPCVARPDGASP